MRTLQNSGKMGENKAPSVLIIEDNESHSFLIAEKFRSAFPGIELCEVRSLLEASQILTQHPWDLILLNSNLSNGSGMDFLNSISHHHPHVAVAVLHDESRQAWDTEWKHHGAVEFLKKDRDTLESLIIRAQRLMETSRHIQQLLSERPQAGKEDLSFRDELTRVYSRTYFEESLHREVSRANRYKHEFSLLMIDVDQLAHINENHGRETGDHCLKKLADMLLKSVRSGDIVARYGEDEFIMLLTQCRQADAMKCAERIVGKAKSILEKSPFSVSVGLFHYKGLQKVYRLENIVEQTHGALRSAKQEGGSCYKVAV